MHYKIKAILLAASTALVLRLAVLQQLNLYIHPRYIVFTITMASIAAVLVILNLTSKSSKKERIRISMIPLLLVLFFGLTFPAKSLTSSTVSQRSVSGTQPLSANSGDITKLFANSSRSLSLEDWTRIIGANTSDSYFAKKQVKVSGFIYNDGVSPSIFKLSRFIVTCCAIDAQPIGVGVYEENWNNLYDEDQWLEIEGEFKTVDSKILLVPSSITKIEEPENPYAN